MNKFGIGLALLCLFGPGALFAMPVEEEARVERLLLALQEEKNLVFIRNGTEYSAQRAGDHLRLKFERSRAYLHSAEEFIDKAGTRSSVSGNPYLVRHPGREPVSAGTYLHELLRRTIP